MQILLGFYRSKITRVVTSTQMPGFRILRMVSRSMREKAFPSARSHLMPLLSS